jgi:hypothetical protein
VVLSGRVRARGHGSEAAVEGPFGGLYEFRSGKVIRVQIFGSRAEAVEAVGMREAGSLEANPTSSGRSQATWKL